MSILKDSLAGRIAEWGSGAVPNLQPALPVDGRSYLRGSAHPPLAHITIPRLLASSVAQFGPRDALMDPLRKIRLSYYDLDRAVDELASGLLALGLGRGEVVALQSGETRAHVLRLAVARAGLVIAELAPDMAEEAVLSVLRSSEARVFVPDTERAVPASLRDLPRLKTLLKLDGPTPEGSLILSQLRAMAGPAQQLRLPGIDGQTDPDDVAMIVYDGDRADGLAFSHYALVNAARCLAGLSGLAETDRFATCLSGLATFLTGLLPSLTSGAALHPVVLEDLGVALERTRCTVLRADRVGAEALSSGDFPRTLRMLLPAAGSDAGRMQGIACPVHTQDLPGGLPLCLAPDGGWIQPHLEAKIVDQAGRIVALGHEGQLCIRGFAVTTGYWTRAGSSLRDGWMDTGIDAAFDAEGRLCIRAEG